MPFKACSNCGARFIPEDGREMCFDCRSIHMQVTMHERRQIYCFTMFFGLPDGRKCFYMNRKYEVLGDNIEVWGPITIRDLLVVDEQGNRFFSPKAPQWAKDLHADGWVYVTFWTNYYE